jgi:peptide/nickel transport system substrate-binding protein
MMTSRIATLLAIVVLAGTLLAPAARAETPTEGGTLVVALPGDIQRTDSALTDDTNSAYVMNQVMQGLVGLKPGSVSEIIPVLASSWTVSPDGRSYTFELRKGIKFHDGTEFDANAVKFNYDRWLHIPDSYSKLQYTYFIDVALKPVVDSVAVNGPGEVTITLKAPNSSFLTTQTLPPFFIASPKALQAGDANDPDFSKNVYAQGGPMALTGTGPFKFKEWVPSDHVTLVKNTDYWDKANAAHIDVLKFETNFPNSTATLNALQSGGIDVAQTMAPIDSKTAASDPNLQALDRGGSCNLFELAMNQTHKPFDNLKVRQAVAYAINKQALIPAFYAGQAVLADNWMPAGLFAYKALHLPAYDPAKAKALITESGVSDLSFDFWYPSNVARPYMPDPKGEFQAILSDLEAVGFKPNPKTATWSPDYLTGIGGQYPMYLLGLTCDWASPDNFLSANLFGYKALSDGSFGPNPRYNEKNDALQKAMQDALMAPNPEDATKHWQEAQDILAADMPTVPILSSNPPAVMQKYVKGFAPSATLMELYNTVWIAPH